MTQTREQFYKTTQQYFQNTYENNYKSEKNHSEPAVRKFYIQEKPFIDSNETK